MPYNTFAQPRHINDAGLSLVQKEEGLRLTAYPDWRGIWTIGWGHTAGVYQGMVITRDQAIEFLKEDLLVAEQAVSRLVTVPLNDNQFSALVSFTFNEGQGELQSSTLLKLLNQGKYDQVPVQLPRWNRSNGTVLDDLTNRRADEANLWKTPIDGAVSI